MPLGPLTVFGVVLYLPKKPEAAAGFRGNAGTSIVWYPDIQLLKLVCFLRK